MAKPLKLLGSVAFALAAGAVLRRHVVASWVRVTHTYARSVTRGGRA